MAETLTIRTASSTEIVKIAVPGPQGPAGSNGQGVPTGGSTGQLLRKKTGSDYDTEWADAGSGQVSSVNGQEGAVVLTAADVGAAATTHAASHGPSGSDPLTHAFRVAVSSGSFSGTLLYAGESNGKPSWGESGQDVVTLSWNGTKWQLFPAVGGGTIWYESTSANIFSATWSTVSGGAPTPTLTFDFVRLGDFANPVHTHVASDVTDLATVASSGSYNDLLDAPALGTAAAADIGSGAGQVCAGDDARLSDTRTPSAHKNSHATGGTDALSAADIGAAAASHSHIPSEVGLGNVSNTAQVTSVTGTAPIVSSGGTTPSISIQNNPTLTGDVIVNGASTGVSGSLKVGSTTGSFNSDVELGSTGVVIKNASGTGTTTIARGNGGSTSYTLTPPAKTGTIAIAGDYAAIATSGSASDLAAGTVPIGRLGASGTPSASTYLAGDNSWKAVSGVITGNTDNAVLRADGTGGSTSQSSDIIIDDAATATQNNVSIRNNHSQTNSALVLCNKGTGAFIVSPARPDGTATGGNARGDEAVCIVPSRDNANQVASGAQAVAIGKRARASGGPSAAFGNAAAATGNGSCALGPSCSASSNDSFCAGNSASSAASGSVAIGWLASASGVNSFAAAGLQTSATLRAQFAVPAFNAVYWSGQTTTNAATILNLDGSATNRFTIAASTALAVDILLVARRATTQDKWLVARRFLGIRRDGSNNTALIGAVQTLGTDQSAGSPTWTFALTADDTNEALQLEVTGATGETVEWRATAFYRVA